MPSQIKIFISLLVLVTGSIAGFFFHAAARSDATAALAFLVPFMIAAIWIFPEVQRTDTAGETVPRSERR
ncbi:hypothetical protein SAMN05216338_106628 [Bradyrhizobium sp. Rc2d]|nr:hypothetical protein SAMN05216338_106628 [Bradyrhizobium sp. Rc2d]